jgi:hypothetical protein
LNFNDLTDSQLARNRVGQSKRHRKRNGGNWAIRRTDGGAQNFLNLKFLAPFNTRRYRYQKSVKENKKKSFFLHTGNRTIRSKKKMIKTGDSLRV